MCEGQNLNILSAFQLQHFKAGLIDLKIHRVN